MKNYLILFFIALVSNLSLSAQSMIEGGINDENGEAITAAIVTMHNESNVALTQEMATDETGYFIMEDIADGAYSLEISITRYETIKIENFQFPRDRDKVVGLTMVKKRNYIQMNEQNNEEKISTIFN